MPSIPRIRPPLRPLRPPRPPNGNPQPRFFAHRPQLLLLSRHNLRPNLPFLIPSNRLIRSRTLQYTLSRLLTTSQKRFLKSQAYIGTRYLIHGFLITSLGLVFCLFMTHQLLEHEFPTPEEWSFLTRCALHCAKGLEEPSVNGAGITEWGYVGRAYTKTCRRLEDPGVDGKGIKRQQEGEGISVGDVGEVGFDISEKSEPWRRGYWETLMGLAKSAENLDGDVYDKKGKHIFPAKYVIGPNNPDPMPTPPWMFDAPLEENCVPAFEPPEKFYIKILTTKGFSNKQRMEAALAYGEWLDFKNMPDTADEVYKWALDIASSSLEQPGAVIDGKTAVLRPDAPFVTENVLSAATALGTHYAQTARPDAALPIFLSVLRARRDAPVARSPPQDSPKKAPPQTDIGAMIGYVKGITSFLGKVDYPPPPPSGETPIVRTVVEDCEEAKLMTYIGEILFATSKSRHETGLRWTKDAVEIANARVQEFGVRREELLKCADCLEVGISNWRMMMNELVEEQDGKLGNLIQKNRKSWFSFRRSGFDAKSKQGVLQEEQEELEKWEERLQRDNLKEKLMDRGTPLWGTRLLLVF